MADAEFTTERWLPVVERPEVYEISSHGRARSVDHTTIGKDGKLHVLRGVLLKPQERTGYLLYSLWVGERVTGRMAHRLVFSAFVGPIPDGLEINHIDGVKTNNRIENLELVTAKENCAHAVRLGLAPFGQRKPSARLTDDEARQIVRRRAAGERSKDLAAEFGLAACTIANLVGGRNWNHVTGLPSRRRSATSQRG